MYSLEALQTRTDVLHQDKHPCFFPTRGPGPAALSVKGQLHPDHQLWPAVSHLSPRHCQQWVGTVDPLSVGDWEAAIRRASCIHNLAHKNLMYSLHLSVLLSHISLCLIPGGHYIAYCRNDVNNLWYEFDDQSVTEVSESCVQNAEAYVLFYK